MVGPVHRPGWVRDLLVLAVANGALGGTAWGAWQLAARALAALRTQGIGGAGWVRAVLLFAVIGVAFVVYVGFLRLFRFRGAEELWQLPAKVMRRLRGRR